MDWRVPLADLEYGEEEEAAVLHVLRGKWLTMGAVTQEFETQFARMTGVKYAIAVSNGTEALHLACLAIGIGPGDEVIVPSLSFVATANAVLYTGAEVRFADVISEDELSIDPAEVERSITPRTKAIIVMHYGGYPCRMKEICEIAEKHRLAVIEDAAHAPGASLDGRALGSWGTAGCFSFFSNKNLSTGEGGMVITNKDELAEKIRLLRSHGMTTLTYDRHQGHAHSYDVIDLGFNYRIDEIRSALGLVQIKKLKSNNTKRKTWTERYWELLNGTGMEFPFYGKSGTPSYHIFPTLLPKDVDRKAFMDTMRAEGIQTSIHYPPTHSFSYYQSRYGNVTLPKTDAIARREITLPLFPGMGADRVDFVSACVRRALNK